jgi:hypothetical protein
MDPLKIGTASIPLVSPSVRMALGWWRAWSVASELDKPFLEAAAVGLLAEPGHLTQMAPDAEGKMPSLVEYGEHVWRDLEVMAGPETTPSQLFFAIQPAAIATLRRVYPEKKKVEKTADFSEAPGAPDGSPGRASPSSGSGTPESGSP